MVMPNSKGMLNLGHLGEVAESWTRDRSWMEYSQLEINSNSLLNLADIG